MATMPRTMADVVADPTAIAAKAIEFQETQRKAGKTVNIAEAVAHVVQRAENSSPHRAIGPTKVTKILEFIEDIPPNEPKPDSQFQSRSGD